MKRITGRKDSGKGSTAGSSASEAPNTLWSRATARVVEIISHGECVGLANRENPLRSIMFDGVKIQEDDGTNNFTGISFQERFGLPDQDPFTGFNDTENTEDIELPITVANPRIYSVTASFVAAVRVTVQIDALSEQDTTTGGIKGSSVSYTISSRIAGGAFQDVMTETLNDKTTSPQQLSYRIERPAGADDFTNWDVKVTRNTPDPTTITVQNTISLATVTELVNSNLQYADYASIAIEIDAKQFGSSIPTRSYDYAGMVLDVPSNYTPPDWNNPNDPSGRIYTGLWDGTFKRAWSDNPAWILWAMLTNKEWGLGKVIQPGQVDKWALYQIAQYCDELVPDGSGGMEPRYVVNTQITSAEEAYAMLQSIASTFRGMLYWGPGSVTFIADQPKDPVKLVTPANIVNGEFTYQGAALKARHTVARVTWNDPSDQYKAAIEVVEDPAMIDRFGYRDTSVIAFGCTNRSQANRMGRWILDTEAHESEMVTYEASFDHADLRPGDIIQVHDPYYAGARYGGRIISISGTSATIDSPIELLSGQSYSITLTRPDGVLVKRTITTGPGTTSTLSWTGDLAGIPSSGTVTIFRESENYSTQSSQLLVIDSNSATLLNSVVFQAGVTYDLTWTDVGGNFHSVTLPVHGSDAMTNTLSWSTAAFPVPTLGSTVFISPAGEGFTSRTASSISNNSATLSSSVVLAPDQAYRVSITLSDGAVVERTLTNSPGSISILTWDDTLNGLPDPGSMWGLTATNLAPREFRVLGVAESAPNVFKISALFYDRNKYARIEDGLDLPDVPSTIFQINAVPAPPTNLQAFRRPILQADGSFIENIVAFWTASVSSFVKQYRVAYKFENEAFITLTDVTSPTVEFVSSGIGTYTFSVIAISQSGKESVALLTSLDVTDERPLAESIIQNIRVDGSDDVTQDSPVIFTGKDLAVQWDLLPPPDWVNPDAQHWDDPYFRNYRINVLPPGVGIPYATYFVTDKRFTFTYDMNVAAGGPYREFRIGVTLQDTSGNFYTEITQDFFNPPPTLTLVNATIGATDDAIVFKFDEPLDSDYAGIIVWVDSVNPVVPSDANRVWQGRGQPQIPADPITTYFYRYAFFDTFGTTGLDISPTASVLTAELMIDGHTASYWVDQIASIDSAGLLAAGAAADKAISDAISNATSILQIAMNNVADRGYLEALTYDDTGSPIKTVVQNSLIVQDGLVEAMNLLGVVSADGNSFILDVNTVNISPTETFATRLTNIGSSFSTLSSAITVESNTRASADSAQANVISKIGALSSDGSAFILDGTTAMVSPTESLGTRLSTINSTLASNTASISTESTARTTADSSFANTLSKIGALNGGGTAFVFDSSTAQVSGGVSLATSLSTINATLGSQSSSISVLSSASSSMGAKWGVSIDVNGHITGIVLNNNGASSAFVVVTDNFAVVNSSGTVSTAPFTVSGGQVHMTDVVVHTLAANTITANNIIGGAVTSVSAVELAYGSVINGTAVQILTLGHTTTISGAPHLVAINVNAANSGANAGVLVSIHRDSILIAQRSFFATGSFVTTGSWNVFDQPASGSHLYDIVVQTTGGSGTACSITFSNMTITELKK